MHNVLYCYLLYIKYCHNYCMCNIVYISIVILSGGIASIDLFFSMPPKYTCTSLYI